MRHSEMSGRSLITTVSGLTRLLLVILLSPGILAAAAVAGALSLLLVPLIILVGPLRRTGQHPAL
jgi:hypothetical protein